VEWWRPDVTRADLRQGLAGVVLPAAILLCHILDHLGFAHGLAIGVAVAALAFVNEAAWGTRRRIDLLDQRLDQLVSTGLTNVLNDMLRQRVIVPGPNFPRGNETQH